MRHARERHDRRSSGVKKNSKCCCGAGRRQRPAKAKWCCSPVRPGIGKSRLTAALLERLVAEPHTRLRYFCSPQHTDSALYPIIGQLERAAGLRALTMRCERSSISWILSWLRTPPQVRTRHSLPKCCRCRTTDAIPTLELTPQQRRQRTMEALTAQTGGAVASQIQC